MRSRKATWLSGIGAVVLIGMLVVVNYGTGIPQAGAQAAPPNPLTVIINKLNEILAAIGGIQQGNHTLRWDQNLPAAQRFVVLASFANAAVLDKNTGLVWEQSPATPTHTWTNARVQCANKNVGGQKGWRLPSFSEQASLVDPSVAPPGPTLPPVHPFTNVQPFGYWSASTNADFPTSAWNVFFDIGNVGASLKANSYHVWCVRGGMQESVY